MDHGSMEAVKAEIRAIAERQDEHGRTLRDVATALQSLVRLEERMATSNEGLVRAFKALEQHGERLQALEVAQPPLLESRKWMVRAIIFLLTAMIGGFFTGNITIHATAPSAEIHTSK